MEGRFGYVVLTARYFYVTALVHLTKDFDDLIYSVSFLFHDSGRVLARQSLIFNGPVYGGQVNILRELICGFLNRRSQVRFLPPVPFIIKDLRNLKRLIIRVVFAFIGEISDKSPIKTQFSCELLFLPAPTTC